MIYVYYIIIYVYYNIIYTNYLYNDYYNIMKRSLDDLK